MILQVEDSIDVDVFLKNNQLEYKNKERKANAFCCENT